MGRNKIPLRSIIRIEQKYIISDIRKEAIIIFKRSISSFIKKIDIVESFNLLINKKKICGILIESNVNADKVECIVGIGINYSLPKKESWWGEIGELADILPREKLINGILRGIISYAENGYENWKDAWEKRCMHMGIELKAVSNNQKEAEIGIFNGINEEGKMLLQTATELKIISSGECSIKGIY